MRSNKDEFSLEINEHYSVLAYAKTIKISQIRGFKPGSIYGHEVKMLTSPLVKKDGDGYVLLNYLDPRISSILDKYDSNTKVEVMIIPSEHSEAVEFLAGDLNPQITPTTKFTDFFTNLSQSHSKQIFVRDFFTRQGSRSKSKLEFNLKRFMEKLGANAPSQTTASKIASSANSAEVSTPTLEKLGTVPYKHKSGSEINTHSVSDTSQHTQKTQVSEVIDKEEALVEAAAELYYRIEPTTYDTNTDERIDTQSEQSLTEEKALSHDEYHRSEEFLNSTDKSNKEEATISPLTTTKTKAHIDLTEEEMGEKWENHSNSSYPFALLRKILGPRQNQALTDRLNNLQPNTPEFDKFLSTCLELIEDRLQEIKKHDHTL